MHGGGGRLRPEEPKREAGGSRWLREQDDKYALFFVAIHGQENVKTQDVLYTQRAAQATAADQAALTKCNVSDAKSMDRMLYQSRRNRVEADQGKEWLVSPVSPSTTGSQATMPSPEASTTMQTKRPRGRPTPWSGITFFTTFPGRWTTRCRWCRCTKTRWAGY